MIIKVKKEDFSPLMRRMKRMRLQNRSLCSYLRLGDSRDFQKSLEGVLIKPFIEVLITILEGKLRGV